MAATLGIWFLFAFGVHAFAPVLNTVIFFGFPLGYYLAAQGSLIAFVVLTFWFSARQDRIDRECNLSEEE